MSASKDFWKENVKRCGKKMKRGLILHNCNSKLPGPQCGSTVLAWLLQHPLPSAALGDDLWYYDTIPGRTLTSMVARGTSTPLTSRLLRIKVWTSMGKNWRFGLKGSVHGICQQWCEDRALTLLEGAPQTVTAWSQVLHNEKVSWCLWSDGVVGSVHLHPGIWRVWRSLPIRCAGVEADENITRNGQPRWMCGGLFWWIEVWWCIEYDWLNVLCNVHVLMLFILWVKELEKDRNFMKIWKNGLFEVRSCLDSLWYCRNPVPA